MPFWYKSLFIGVVSAIYGLKGADIMKKPKLKKIVINVKKNLKLKKN